MALPCRQGLQARKTEEWSSSHQLLSTENSTAARQATKCLIQLFFIAHTDWSKVRVFQPGERLYPLAIRVSDCKHCSLLIDLRL